MTIAVRPMERGDLAGVIAIHLSAFPSFFLSFLGPRFLRELYAATMRDGVALVATIDARVAGFAAGTVVSKSFYRRLLRERFVHLALAIAPAIMRRPSTFLRVVRRAR